MITKYDVYRAFDRAVQDGVEIAFKLNDDKTKLYDSKTDEYVCSIDTYVQYLREKLHCDFECIYHEHVSLTAIIRCKQCGTVIFTGDDERYEPNLKCPTCSDYKPYAEYWTKEDIDNDPKKQETINFYMDLTKEMIEAEKRREARGGLYDWQLFKKDKYYKKYGYHIELRRFKGKNIFDHVTSLDIDISVKDDDGIGYIREHHISIPLSLRSIYIDFFYPYSKKCPQNLRKYHFWQKKPTE